MQDALPRMSYLSRLAFLRDRTRGRAVLHLGCSSGRCIQDRLDRNSLLHGFLSEETSELYGLDIDPGSLSRMRDGGFANLYEADVESLEKLELNKQFDLVLAGDILEHLSRPGSMLDGVKRFLRQNGELKISTNNAFGFHYQLRRWMGHYTEHFQHVCFFSPETLLHLLERHGYRVREMYGAYTEPPHTWKQKLEFALGKPLFKLAPVLAGTLIVVAALKSESNDAEPEIASAHDGR